MNNPIALTRQIIQQQMGEQTEKKGPTPEEVAKELERLQALHEGWVTHPITMMVIQKLKADFEQAQQKAFADARLNIPSTKIVEAASLSDILNYINTLR